MTLDIQKASMLKRFSAYLLDIIIVAILAVGFGLGLSAVTGYDSYNETFFQVGEKYEAEYGVNFEMTQEQWEAMTQEEIDRYNEAYGALLQDEEAMFAYNMIVNLTLMITSLGILLAYLVWEFAIPLWLGNGQTAGKKIFGIALMRVDGVKVTPLMMFVRTILGKYTIGTMIPVLLFIMMLYGSIGIVGPLIIIGLAALQLGLMLFSQNHTAIHDYLSQCVAVDMSSQMIFDTSEQMQAYQQKLQDRQEDQENA